MSDKPLNLTLGVCFWFSSGPPLVTIHMVETAMGWLTSAKGVFRLIFREREQAKPEPKPDPDLMIVRRGHTDAFYFYCHVIAKEHNLAVVPDRRVRDRRRRQRATPTIDRRALERRGEPVHWPFEDFVIVRDPRRTPRPEES